MPLINQIAAVRADKARAELRFERVERSRDLVFLRICCKEGLFIAAFKIQDLLQRDGIPPRLDAPAVGSVCAVIACTSCPKLGAVSTM